MYQSFIGLEVHIHLLTKTKVFCGCRSAFGDEPNTNICPVCMGYPGVLPSLNAEALRMGCVVAAALNCAIPERTWFERKQYFYPDMPKNYQISQFASPLGRDGYLDIEGRGIQKQVRIKECHLEEDAGKMIHTGAASLLDYNRAGMALLEIVTEPDMETGEEAELFIQQLRRLVRYLGVCDGNMEEGSLRADANVSINRAGRGLGNKVEIKNLNSSRFVRLGLTYEILRQSALLDAGKPVVQETRLWNQNRDQTEQMRVKENAHDYRYFPEPDLPVFAPDPAFLNAVKAGLVELPLPRTGRFERDYGLGAETAEALCDEKALADYFEEAAALAETFGLSRADGAARLANWLLTDMKRALSRAGVSPAGIGSFTLTARRLASLVSLVALERVSMKNGKQAFEEAVRDDRDPESIIKERGWERLTDSDLIGEAVRKVADAEARTVDLVKAARAAGNRKRERSLTAYLVGKVLEATGGRADPKIAGAHLNALLTPPSPQPPQPPAV
ncbi:MAG: Asp-tRNA(Asn)/Glu-tRNA(Gln) amidotransferase subunit GatB [Spirochaetaceae bacterium]|jgi:aspartyl-tRNA(Asn)/glutamyl-tRNA(Gln) amidotransferase subunit B|nr:Asp-tRNA(Asn)/Glu-tRNA(Gln) amidotransferase subunit GatB [Spirochaetaceae bacterium]